METDKTTNKKINNDFELKRCPYCGAYIPLIAKQCPYCGKDLPLIDKNISKEKILTNFNSAWKILKSINLENPFQYFMRYVPVFSLTLFILFLIIRHPIKLKIFDNLNAAISVLSFIIFIISLFIARIFKTKKKEILKTAVDLETYADLTGIFYPEDYLKIKEQLYEARKLKKELLKKDTQMRNSALRKVILIFTILVSFNIIPYLPGIMILVNKTLGYKIKTNVISVDTRLDLPFPDTLYSKRFDLDKYKLVIEFKTLKDSLKNSDEQLINLQVIINNIELNNVGMDIYGDTVRIYVYDYLTMKEILQFINSYKYDLQIRIGLKD